MHAENHKVFPAFRGGGFVANIFHGAYMASKSREGDIIIDIQIDPHAREVS